MTERPSYPTDVVGMNPWTMTIKRVLDIVISGLALILLSPVLVLIALVVRCSSPGSALFRHQRLGKDGAPFTMYKFRTMYPGSQFQERRDDQGGTIITRDDVRITWFGRKLRNLSLDELPQLLNVFIGEMSLVGPRPDQAKDIVLYSESDRIKLRMKPGLTSLAIVNGRNSIPWRERMDWEIKYVENYSLMLDMIILLRTIKVMVTRESVYTSSQDDEELIT